MKELELYLHIPFCVRKCAYCDFLSFPAGRQEQDTYVKALMREAAAFPYKDAYEVTTVFFGGGTPSLLLPEQIAGLLEVLHREFHFADRPEVTIECNPGTVGSDAFEIYRQAGVNRLSLGLQSADNSELLKLGRIHTWECFLETYQAARARGFSNVNIDLMSALPGQTVASWECTLKRVLALKPEHLSAYSLIIEEGTPFYEAYAADDAVRAQGGKPRYLPSEDEERAMYELTEELLGAAGLRRYEISNYALPGYECSHNIGYWTGVEYAGFGLGASSMLRLPCDRENSLQAKKTAGGKREAGNIVQNGHIMEQYGKCVRLRNPEDMRSYLAGDFSARECQSLSREEEIEEFMFLGLRLTDGVSEQEFCSRFGCSMEEIYGEVLKKYCSIGLLMRKGGRVFLTPRGRDVSNTVMAEFLYS